jgi:hypothetical protein
VPTNRIPLRRHLQHHQFTPRALEAFGHLRESPDPSLSAASFYWYDQLVGELLARGDVFPWEITDLLLRPDVTPQDQWEERARQRWLDLEHALERSRAARGNGRG